MQDRNSRHLAPGRKIASWLALSLLVLVLPVIVGIIAISVFSTVFSATGSFFGELMQCGDGGCRTPMPIVFVPTPDPRLFMSAELGTKLTYDDKQLLVTSVTQATSYGKATAADGYRLIAVHIDFTDLTDSQLDMSTSNFDVTDSAGHIYTRIKDAATPALSSQPASSPPSAAGWLTFQVPERASDLILQYNFTSSNATATILEIHLGALASQNTVIPTASPTP